MQYRTRGQRYDDLLVSVTSKKKSGRSKLWSRLESFLWSENEVLDVIAVIIGLGVMAYFIGAAIMSAVRAAS